MRHSERTWNVIYVLAFVAACLLVTILKIWIASKGHNYDMDSWQIVSDLRKSGKNVYAFTDRYNYGPVWFVVLGLLGWIHRALHLRSLLGVESFHMVVAGFLSLVDIAVAVLLYRRAGGRAAAFFLLNPLSILLTGFHSQFDMLAILPAYGGWILLSDEQMNTRNLRNALLLFGLSLATKQILIFFPFWLVVAPLKLSRRQRFAAFAVPYLVCAAIVAPYAVAPGALDGILRNLPTAGTVATRDTLIHRTLEAILPINFLLRPLAIKILFTAILCSVGRVMGKRNPRTILEQYLLAFTVAGPMMATQYLAIPLVACATAWRHWAGWAYTIVSVMIVQMFMWHEDVIFHEVPAWRLLLHDGFGYSTPQALLAVLLVFGYSAGRNRGEAKNGIARPANSSGTLAA